MKKLALVLIAVGFGATGAFAQTFPGNGGGGFGGPIGGGTISFTSDGTTLFGTITTPAAFGDELVIYIDSQAGGFTSTSGFTDTGGGTDILREAVSGLGADGTTRAALNFAPGFAADFALALSPSKANFGGLFSLSTGTFGFVQGANLTPTGTSTGPFTFSISLASIGSPTAFTISTTYLNGVTAVRSNEAFGNTIVDVTNPLNTGNLGQDTGLATFVTVVAVPEPSTWAMMLGGLGLLVLLRRRTA